MVNSNIYENVTRKNGSGVFVSDSLLDLSQTSLCSNIVNMNDGALYV